MISSILHIKESKTASGLSILLLVGFLRNIISHLYCSNENLALIRLSWPFIIFRWFTIVLSFGKYVVFILECIQNIISSDLQTKRKEIMCRVVKKEKRNRKQSRIQKQTLTKYRMNDKTRTEAARKSNTGKIRHGELKI